MARLMTPTPEQEAGYRNWLATRPDHVRQVAERFDPWSLYRLKTSGHRVTVASFGEGEDGAVTLTVNVLADFNLVMFERQVFGIQPDDLEPCDLPAADERLGAMLAPAEVDDHLDELRVMVRPDLWELDPDTGKAIKKPTH